MVIRYFSRLALWSLLVFGVFIGSAREGGLLHAQGFGMSGTVRALAITPNGTLLAGTFGSGLYQSRDKGIHWTKISEGLPDQYILTILPVDDTELYVGTVRKGIARSRDGGKTWKEINEGLGRREVKHLMFHKGTLYAGTGDGVYSSPNHGEKWEPFNEGMKRVLVRTMLVDGKGILFAGTEGKGLFRRDPRSPSWTQVTRGFEGGQGMLENFLRTLTMDAEGNLYAGTFDGGVFVSRDGGKRWTWWSTGMRNQSIRAVLVGPGKILYVGTGKGIFARRPGDDEWKLISEELEDDSVQSMVVDSTGLVYAGTTQGLYKGTIEGKWETVTPGLSQILDGNTGEDRGMSGPSGFY